MTLQLDVATRNAMIDAFEAAVGTSPRLQFWTGSIPATCAAASTGTKLAEIVCPADFLAAAAGGLKTILGSWAVTAIAAGTSGYFRLMDSGVTVCKMQGTVTITGGGGDLTLDNPVMAIGQTVTITTFSLTAGNL